MAITNTAKGDFIMSLPEERLSEDFCLFIVITNFHYVNYSIKSITFQPVNKNELCRNSLFASQSLSLAHPLPPPAHCSCRRSWRQFKSSYCRSSLAVLYPRFKIGLTAQQAASPLEFVFTSTAKSHLRWSFQVLLCRIYPPRIYSFHRG